MAYIVVENFSAGLDTRKHPLTARPGTLQTLKNAHISRGGEIEKRKRFAPFGVLPANTFGLEATETAIYVFGSNPAPTMPAGILYQRLISPTGSAMTDVVFSTLYGGFPFVIAKFADGKSYPYYNGSIITDFYGGVTNTSMGSLAAAATHMASIVNLSGSGYSAVAAGAVVTVTGPIGVAFTPTATIEAPMTVTIAKTQTAVAGTAEKLAAANFAVTAGSTCVAASGFRTLVNISSTPKLMAFYIGSTKVADSPSTGAFAGGFDATTMSYPGDPLTPAQRLASNIDLFLRTYHVPAINIPPFGMWRVSDAEYAATSVGGLPAGRITFKTLVSDQFYGSPTASTVYDNPAQWNGQSVWIEFDSNPNGHSHTSELIDTATIVASPYNAGRYIARMTTLAGGVTNGITSVKVDGVEILGSPVKWYRSNTETMDMIAQVINGYSSSTEYTASVANGTLILSAIAGSGSTPNGKIVSVTVTGNASIGNLVSFSGGVTGVNNFPQKSTFTLGGSYANGVNITFKLSPDSDPASAIYVGASRVSNTTPVSALTFKTKAHITSGSSLFFSGVNQPTNWGENGTGAGFINLSNNSGGNEALTALALYQGNLAAFARRSVQLWAIDTDPANNRQGQVLSNTGTFAANSVVSVGEIDVFYLSDSGVRSLRARDASNAAVVNDVGTPIDNLILADLADFTEAQKATCCAIIEPIDGRYWIAIGSKVYVYSYFPNSQVAAWSIYEPGFSITKFTTKDGRVFARAGNNVYLYGGVKNAEYDSSEVEVVLPYLDGGKPAHQKMLNGIDMTCEGSWAVSIGMDPVAPIARDPIATITQPTFSLGRIMAVGTGTHVGIRLVNNAAGYARIANLIAHFEANEAN